MPLHTVSINPLEISSLVNWIDASDISTINNGSSTLDGDTIVTVADKKDGNLWTSSTTGPQYKLNFINNRNVIYCKHSDTTNRSIKSPLYTPVSPLTKKTVFLVYICDDDYIFNTTGNVGLQYPLSVIHQSNTLIGAISPLNQRFPDFNISYNYNKKWQFYSESLTYTSEAVDRKTTNVLKNETQIIGVRTSDRNINKYDFLINSKSIDNQYGDEYLVSGYPSLDRYYIHLGDIVNHDYTPSVSQPPYAVPFCGYICEFLLFNDILSDWDYNRVMEYLKSKWVGS